MIFFDLLIMLAVVSVVAIWVDRRLIRKKQDPSQ